MDWRPPHQELTRACLLQLGSIRISWYFLGGLCVLSGGEGASLDMLGIVGVVAVKRFKAFPEEWRQ